MKRRNLYSCNSNPKAWIWSTNLAAELNQEVSLKIKRMYSASICWQNTVWVYQVEMVFLRTGYGRWSFSALMAEATRYIGYPYVWGGSSPDTSFDCGGYICWSTQIRGITFPEQQLRGFMTSVRLCQERKLDPEIWCFYGNLCICRRSAMWGFMLEALGCCIVVRLLAMRTLLLLTGTAICMLLEGWQLFRNEAAKNEICADLPGQFMDMWYHFRKSSVLCGWKEEVTDGWDYGSVKLQSGNRRTSSGAEEKSEEDKVPAYCTETKEHVLAWIEFSIAFRGWPAMVGWPAYG